jgi:ABC-type nickel/cobalt efflux system permease component RcnA
MPSAELFLAAWSGFLAGSLHVASGVDHLAALLPLSVGQRRWAFAIGAGWGLGHSAGVLVIGVLGLLLKQRIDVAATSGWAERGVGVMLVALGVLGVRRGLRLGLHTHLHVHDGVAHAHLHVHGPATKHAVAGPASETAPGPQATPHRHHHTAFAAGILHGVAGTAHVLGVLPALALSSVVASIVYLLTFALGTVMAMAVFAAVVGEGTARAAERAPALLQRLTYGAGAASILVGLIWIVAG